MPAPTNTLLIEGSFTELASELAQYIDSLRRPAGEGETNVDNEISPLLESLRKAETSEEETSDAQKQATLKQRDEVLKKVVGAASALNSSPERGVYRS